MGCGCVAARRRVLGHPLRMESVDPTSISRRTSYALDAGATRRQLRGEQWSHPYRGVVRPAYVGLDPLSEILADAAALAREHGALGGWAALAAQGNTWFDGLDGQGERRDVLVHCWNKSQLRVRPGITPIAGTRPSGREVLGRLGRGHHYGSCSVRRDAPRAGPPRGCRGRSTWRAARPRASRHTTIDEVARVVKSHAKTRGITQARWALGQAVSRSASPWETRTRLMAELDADIRGLQVNVPVFDLFGTCWASLT